MSLTSPAPPPVPPLAAAPEATSPAAPSPEAPTPEAPSVSLRIDLAPGARIGPGKVELLERIAADGSISAAARGMSMSYKRAWTLIEEMNGIFASPVVAARKGGAQGGGAGLTPLGAAIVAHYRAIERAAKILARPHLEALRAEIREG